MLQPVQPALQAVQDVWQVVWGGREGNCQAGRRAIRAGEPTLPAGRPTNQPTSLLLNTIFGVSELRKRQVYDLLPR